jgi:hypothetical protein
MNRTLPLLALAAAALIAAPAARADEFAPVKAAESVTYPLPALPMPAPTRPASGKWAETEDSPALRVSRAWVKLGEGAGIERSEATRRLFQSWKNEVGKSGAASRVSQAAHATFLAAYKGDLERARSIYEGVLREIDAIDSEGGTSTQAGESPANSLAREAEEQIRAADRDERLTSSACFLSPDTCQQPDASDKALQDEISRLVKDTLEAGGPDGGLSLYSLKRKAGLLALRARVMAAVTQRAAARLATEVATQADGRGSPKTLPSPISPMATTASSRRSSTPSSDPYQ